MEKTNEIYIHRPKGKPTSTMKGKLNEWENGYREFVPQGTRENQRQMLKQLGDSSFYKTEGRKESSYSLHLNVDGESQDPVAEMHELFLHLTEGQRKQMPTLEEGLEGRMLYDDGQHMKVWLDHKSCKVSILTRLDCNADIERMLLRMQGDMGRVIGRHRSEIVNASERSASLNDK